MEVLAHSEVEKLLEYVDTEVWDSDALEGLID